MTIRKLLASYKITEQHLPIEILDIQIGEKLYDKKYIVIKNYFLQSIQK